MGSMFFKKSVFEKTGPFNPVFQRQDCRFIWFKMSEAGVKQVHDKRMMMQHMQNPKRFSFTGIAKTAHYSGYWWYILHFFFPKKSSVLAIIPIKIMAYLLILVFSLYNLYFLILFPLFVLYLTFFLKHNRKKALFTIKYFKSPVKKLLALKLVFLMVFLKSIMSDAGKIRAFIDFTLLKKVNSKLG